MSRKTLITSVTLIAITLVALLSFKSVNTEGKKITVLKHYASNDDYSNAIIICTPDGKIKKFALLPHKAQNFELNDKMLAQQLNELVATGLQITSIESYGDKSLFVTTYILQ